MLPLPKKRPRLKKSIQALCPLGGLGGWHGEGGEDRRASLRLAKSKKIEETKSEVGEIEGKEVSC